MKISPFLVLIAWILVFAAGCGPHSGSFYRPKVDGPDRAPFAVDFWEEDADIFDGGVSEDARLKANALWEARSALEGHRWTHFSFDTIDKYGVNLISGARDVSDFCPSYAKLGRDQRISFWVFFASAVTKYESAFDPTSRMKETTMGIDPVTKKPVYSEGLLQLSYQDKLAYPFCDEFDWESDKKLDPKDPRKTILDPHKNLACGLKILDWQVKRFGAISFDRGQYWAVLKANGRYTQVKAIKRLTRSLAFCGF